jgi:hypothetical protein
VDAGTFDRTQQSLLLGSFGNPNSLEGELRNPEHHDDELQKSTKSSNATLKKKDLPLKCRRIHVEHVDRHNVRSGLLQPASGGRTRYTVSNGQVKITCGLDQLAKTMIVLLLNSN